MNNYEPLLKEYEEKDKDKIIAFVSRLREETYGSPPPSVDDLRDVKRNYFIFLSAQKDGGIIGTCGLAKNKDGSSEIKRMYIEGALRGKGLGKFLMNKIFDYAIKNNILEITLYTYATNTAAIAFYEKMGFEKTLEKDDRAYFKKKFANL